MPPAPPRRTTGGANRTPGGDDCHRHPENFLRPDNQIFNLDWKPDDVKPAEFVSKYGKPSGVEDDWTQKKKLTQGEIGQTLKEKWNINPPTNCQGCHR